MLSISQYSSIYGSRFYHSVCLLPLTLKRSLFNRVLPEGQKNKAYTLHFFKQPEMKPSCPETLASKLYWGIDSHIVRGNMGVLLKTSWGDNPIS